MAIQITNGRIEHLKFGDSYGFVKVRIVGTGAPGEPSIPSSSNELLIIWSGNQSLATASLFTAQLSQALAHGLRVQLTHKDDSAYIIQVLVEGPFEGALA